MLRIHGRKHERINLSRMAGVTFAGEQQHMYPTQDISLTGMFIIGQFIYQPGTPCCITLTEHWSEQVCVMNFTGKIARLDQKGIAIQFTEMALKPYALLQTVLLYGCSNPMSLGHEFSKGYPFEISEYPERSACTF